MLLTISSLPRLLLDCGVLGADSAHSRLSTKAWPERVACVRRWCPRRHKLADHTALAYWLLYPVQILALSNALRMPSGTGLKAALRGFLKKRARQVLVLESPADERQGLSSVLGSPRRGQSGVKGKLRTGPPTELAKAEA